MKYLFIFLSSLFILFLVSACTSIKGNLSGNYYAKYAEDYFYLINLNGIDSTFEYKSNSFFFRGECKGVWTISNDSIYLHFPDSSDPVELLKAYSLYNQTLRLKINKRNLYYPFLKIKFTKTK